MVKISTFIEEKILNQVDRENYFFWKKANLLGELNGFFLVVMLFIVTPTHCLDFSKHPMLVFGDFFVIIGLNVCIFLLRKGNVFSSGICTVITLMLIPLLHNVIGDWLFPNNVTTTRYFETMVMVCFLFTMTITYSINKWQLMLGGILSVSIVAGHFFVLRLVLGVDIPYTYLLYILIPLALGGVALTNLRITNEAIESLVQSKKQMAQWNKSLEETVGKRTKELVESNKKLEAISSTDGLTEIANRRKFDMQYITEWNRAKKNGNSIALLLIDIDQFKLYNDYFGHVQGDYCLKMVAQQLCKCFRRSGELVARYGGEEFVVLLPDVNAAEAKEYGEKVRKLIELLEIKHSPTAAYGVMTISVGVVARQLLPGDTHEVFLKEADHALYSAKEKGSNRVELA